MTKNPPRIIGICGKKGSGKSTISRIIQEQEWGGTVRTESISSPIKSITRKITSLYTGIPEGSIPQAFFHSQEFKESVDLNLIERYLQKRNWIQSLLFESRLALAGIISPIRRPLITPRRSLQFIGTDAVRNEFPDIWISLFIKKASRLLCSENVGTIVVDDVRMQNEAECIRHRGGIVIRVVPKFMSDECSGYKSKILKTDSESALHSTETEMDSIACDYEIINADIQETKNQIQRILSQCGIERKK